jgi:biopolymer transport protein ExbD
MRRRTISKKHAEIELFPFLSILACTIGTLILLIIVMTTQAVNQGEVSIVAKTDNKDGTNKTKNPRYIECRDDGVVLYPSKKFVPIAKIKDPNSDLEKLIAQIKKNRDREYLIVALRPDGIDVFNIIRDRVRNEKIDIGYEPIESGFKLAIKQEKK